MLKSSEKKAGSNTGIKYSEKFTDKVLGKTLESNIKILKEILKDDDTIIVRQFENQQNNSIKCCIIFVDGMIDNGIVNKNIIWPIVDNTMLKAQSNILDTLQYQVIVSNSIAKTGDINRLIVSIYSGDTILFVDGSAEALIIGSKGWQTRAIEEPGTEKILHGPREGFTESVMINLTLIRRRLKTPDLKFKFRTFGVRSHTKACICYIEGIANEKVLYELNKRLDDVEIDGVLDTGYLQELIKDSPFSFFKTLGNTERPDVVAAKLLEGRIAIILDGSPFALTLPFVFVEYFQSSEDYYVNFYYASISRLIRITSVILSVSVPAFYVALLTFHQEMIPTPLILSISSARQGVPFPTILEAIGLLLVFDIIREAGIRMPIQIGQALSIVGALVLGQAAVQAKLISAPMVIIVAIAGITGLMVPKAKGALIIIRVILLLLASFIGLYGFAFGITGLLIHLFEIRSFGVPYMADFFSGDFQEVKDTAIRAPWWYMEYRPKMIAAGDVIRKSRRSRK